ncbi:MAG: EAL domain-containing protein, partial [Gemmatimonadetes bacterium]|nr:EAL domain-containing protein [Gemmatimonadota bacterium]
MQQTLSHPHIDVAGLIAAGAVETFMQPIASMRRQGLIGVEALTRCQVDGTPIPPPELFGAAERAGLAGELDRLCRRRAIQCFRALHARQPELVLFVNCHPSTLTEAPDALDGWTSLARRYGVDPRNVAVEISEEAMEDPTAARVAARALREASFLVVLD